MLDKVKSFLRSLFLFELIQGLSVTGRYLFRRKITIQYPEVKTPKSPRFRGMHALRRSSDGRERCVGCKLCQSVCPANAIIIDSGANERGERCSLRYDIDQNKCIFCGFCEEACPTNAIVLTDLNEYHGESKEDLYFTKEILLAIGDRYEEDIARARSSDKGDLIAKGEK